MDRHNGYSTKDGEAQCTKCGDWVEQGDDAVLLDPCVVTGNGTEMRPTVIHGILCMGCFDSL